MPFAIVRSFSSSLSHQNWYIKGRALHGVFAQYGWALCNLNRFTEAVEYLDKAVKAFPQDQIAMTQLGISLMGMNEKSKSLKTLKRAYEMGKSTKWTALKYCAGLLEEGKYDKAVEEIPAEIVAHRILHLFIRLLNMHLKQGALQVELAAIERASLDSRWAQAFSGALTEFLGFVAKRDESGEELQDLETWRVASRELYEGREQYQIYLSILNVLVDYKRGAGLASLLSLPLEQRRLIVSEAEEQALGRSLNHSTYTL